VRPKSIFIRYDEYELEVQLNYDVIATGDPSEGKFGIRLRGHECLGKYLEGELIDTVLTEDMARYLDQFIHTYKQEMENECYIWESLT
jgi:hypothetical protein